MAGATRFSACLGCEVRPNDPATGQPVEGELCFVIRQTEVGTAAVVFSYEEPNARKAFVLRGSPESLVAAGRLCGTLPEGLGVHSTRVDDDLDSRLERSRAAHIRNCRLAGILVAESSLPPVNDILAQKV